MATLSVVVQISIYVSSCHESVRPERLWLVVVFYHAGLLPLKIYPRWAVIFDRLFEVCCDLSTVSFGRVLALQDRVVVFHRGEVKGPLSVEHVGFDALGWGPWGPMSCPIVHEVTTSDTKRCSSGY